MQQIAVLSTSSDSGLRPDALSRLVDAIETAGHSIGADRPLSGNKALEVSFTPSPAAASTDLLSDLRHRVFADDGADINIVAAENRRKSLLVADMDSTIITSESLVELARLAGKGGEVDEITERAMRGELDFTRSLRERVRMLEGCPASLIETVIEEAACNPGAEELVATMGRHGKRTVLASGGFTFLTSVVAEKLGFDAHHANTLLVESGRITGEVGDPVMDQNAKRGILDSESRELGVTLEDCATIGDGANDRGMTEAAGLGAAYRGKPALKEVTPHWLDHTDLRGLLWLQGYDDSMIVSARA